jgi:D-amino peptidase
MYPGQPEYEFGREMMTGDVNAAIAGAFDAGATSVVVNDSHWSMRNILPQKLDPRAELIRGFNKPLCMVEQVGEADVAFFVGYHARVGDSDGVANETVLGKEMYAVRMNGRPVGETEINAALAGHFGVPVVLATGDDVYAREVKAALPWVEVAVTKYAIDKWTARCLSPEESWRRIREAARRAVENAAKARPYVVEGPVTFEVEFVSTAVANVAALIPGATRPHPRVVAFTGQDIVEAWRGCLALMLLGATASDPIYG